MVGGVWDRPADTVPVLDPADGSLVGEVGRSGAAEATAAADAAAAAFPAWAELPARGRTDLLLRGADAIAARADELGLLLAREAGKRLPEAVAEIGLSAEYFRWFVEEARRPAGAVHPHEAADRRHLTLHRPSGVAACLTPWNFPCSIQARKLAAALAAGCTVVARVSEKAPLAVTELIRCLVDAGLPPGVVNLVHGPAAEITDAYLAHPAVRVVSFTGSTPVGAAVMATASRRIVRPLLELGGNAPFIVFEDADLDRAVGAAMLAKFRNTGQSCIAANRFLVHDTVHDEFVSRFAARIDAMTVGAGTADPVPDLGPCIDDDRVRDVARLVEDAVERGGRLATRAADVPAGGAFHPPALVVDAPEDCELTSTEVFGPAAGVFRFASEEEAVRRANATEMGLAAYAFTRDADRLWRLGERLEAGIVGFNHPLPTAVFAPMGGVKQSGLGREGSDLGLAEFQDVHYVAVGL
ncbi:aldehyde dehydrogenase family protein [Jiangella asiatica]|uniref:Aldehyde dehydrogenase family protein n=1 Tax=Jiangella asiatica TaxID=2530372 RepID=A0A4R5DI58_9ACTN|nr:aldehyde dehydrogenase family protein [Jiangella asiatica]